MLKYWAVFNLGIRPHKYAKDELFSYIIWKETSRPKLR